MSAGWYTVLWIVWGIAFAGLEGSALRSRIPGTTLSAHIWRITRVADPRPTPLVWLVRLVFAGFGVWLGGHFAMGWWSI